MRISSILVNLVLLLAIEVSHAQTVSTPDVKEATLTRNEARQFFGTYEFEPNFRMRIFSENTILFAQRIGDSEKFQLFAKQPNVFFLKTMPAELEFRRGAGGAYEVLLLRQDGRTMQARRISAQPVELYDTISRLDSLMYQAYNGRRLAELMSYFSPTLEFYHDQTGYTNYEENRVRFQENFAKPTRMRRAVLVGSLQVYPIPGFGAIELGTHRFYQTDPGQPERLIAEPRFVHIWQNTNGNWQIIRVISYSH